MTDKKELNNEQLDKVSGGWPFGDQYKEKYPNPVDKYDTVNYIGQELLFVRGHWYTPKMNDGTPADSQWTVDYLVGIVLKSWEKSFGCRTERTALVQVLEFYGPQKKSGEVELSLDYWEIYSR